MKVSKKVILLTLIFVLFSVFSNMNRAFATSLTEMEKQAQNFIQDGKTNADNGGLDSVIDVVTDKFLGLGQILTTIGAGVLVAVIAYMGIKYLTSSPDKQGALKQQLIGVVVAGVVIFGAFGIWRAILLVVSKF